MARKDILSLYIPPIMCNCIIIFVWDKNFNNAYQFHKSREQDVFIQYSTISCGRNLMWKKLKKKEDCGRTFSNKVGWVGGLRLKRRKKKIYCRTFPMGWVDLKKKERKKRAGSRIIFYKGRNEISINSTNAICTCCM